MAKKKKPIMMIVGALILVAVGYKFVLPMVNPSAPAAALGSPTPFPGPGPTFKMEERVLNVQTTGDTPRYAKLGLGLEFENLDATFNSLAGEARLKFDEEFASEFAPFLPALDDAVITIVSAKSFDELNSAMGKEKLRGELKTAFEEILGEEHKLTSLYFIRFVTQ